MLNKVKFLWQKSPSYMIFWIAQKCNFTCDHCFNHEENKKETSELTLAEVERVSASLGHLKYLTLAGGEPFLRRDIKELATIFIERNELHHLNIITNGWFLDRIVDFCDYVNTRYPQVHLTLNISLDGAEETHDRIRQRPGSFRRCMEVIKALKERCGGQIEIAANGVYNRENALTIKDFAFDIIERQQIPFAINLVRGESIQNEALREVDIHHYLAVARAIMAKNKELLTPKGLHFESLIHGVQSVVLEAIENSVVSGKRLAPCQAGKKGIVLTAGGDVLLCEILGQRLGNLRDFNYQMMDILKSPAALAEIDKIEAMKCHCTWECFQGLNTVFAPKLYPKVLKATV